MFQSTPPRGGRPALVVCAPVASCFNPRPRAGGDANLRIRAVGHVSIHAPARGATHEHCARSRGHEMFQSTPPRGGRPMQGRQWKPVSVSIHAPARGATQKVAGPGPSQRVSIHAPARGATDGLRPIAEVKGFNPRPRAGGDAPRERVRPVAKVSIHAPARGATDASRLAQLGSVSIHAPARGATHRKDSRRRWFQSTPPRGGRHGIPRSGSML